MTEHAVAQFAAIAEYISLDSPVYAEQLVDLLVRRLEQAGAFSEAGRLVPEVGRIEIREFVDPPHHRAHADAIEVLSIVPGRRESPHLPKDS